MRKADIQSSHGHMHEEEDYREDTPLYDFASQNTKRSGYISCCRLTCIALLAFSLFFIGVAAGLLIGKLVFDKDDDKNGGQTSSTNWGGMVTQDGVQKPVLEAIVDMMKAENIKENLRHLTVDPHIAGSDRNDELAHDLVTQWNSYGFDSVNIYNYTVLLTFPNKSSLNVLNIVSSNDFDHVLFEANTTLEKPLVAGEDNPNVVPPYNAYSGIGTVNGTLIYINYGRYEDFELLVSKGIVFNDSVCIVRYGAIFRGNKALLAQKHGCRGLIIYSDPANYAPKNSMGTFPHGWTLPDTGVQRGTLSTIDGDILTPDLPAIDGVHRRLYQDVLDAGQVPSIPVQPISYGDAEEFLSRIGGEEAPKDWQGQINITYHIGPGFSNGSELVYLEVNNEYVNKTITNVIGQIYGSIEPDKLVLLGNHRDAWVFGGADPSSGTAVLMEIANVLGQLRKTGWRPGRTLVLCSWDAEEFGLVGSTEWTQEVSKLLYDRGLGYLNIDTAVSGHDHISVAATPLLYHAIYEAAKMTKSPNTQYPTLYDEWQHYNEIPGTRPYIPNLGSGSDYTPFVQNLGVTAANIRYMHSWGGSGAGSFAVYHSVHDTFYWMEHFLDPQFEYHLATGLVWLNIALQLVTTPLVPYNVTDYGTFMKWSADKFAQSYEQQLLEHNIKLTLFNASVEMFIKACADFQTELDHAQEKQLNDNDRRILNDKLQSLERAFIFSDGLPNRPFFKHLIFAPSAHNQYAGSVFPGVVDAMFEATSFADWQEVDRQLSLLAVHIRYAANILNQYTNPI